MTSSFSVYKEELADNLYAADDEISHSMVYPKIPHKAF